MNRKEYNCLIKTSKKKNYLEREDISLWPTYCSAKARIKYTKSR